MALYGELQAGAQKFPLKVGVGPRGLGHVTPTIFGSAVGYPSDSFASCSMIHPCDGQTDGDSIYAL